MRYIELGLYFAIDRVLWVFGHITDTSPWSCAQHYSVVQSGIVCVPTATTLSEVILPRMAVFDDALIHMTLATILGFCCIWSLASSFFILSNPPSLYSGLWACRSLPGFLCSLLMWRWILSRGRRSVSQRSSGFGGNNCEDFRTYFHALEVAIDLNAIEYYLNDVEFI